MSHIVTDMTIRIAELEYQLREATKKIKQLERERDAAVQCIPRSCGYCKHVIDYGLSNMPGCKNKECVHISGINTGWEWSGVQEVE